MSDEEAQGQVTSAVRTLEQLAAVIMINEVMPRAKRFGFYPPEIIVGLIFRAEYAKMISRRKSRELLDEFYQVKNDLRTIQPDVSV